MYTSTDKEIKLAIYADDGSFFLKDLSLCIQFGYHRRVRNVQLIETNLQKSEAP